MKEIRKLNAITNARLIEAMLDGTLTCQELADHTGLHYVTVLQYTRELHRAGAAHVCQWEQDSRGRHMIRVYKLGRGRDARRPKLTSAERQARTRQARKAMDQTQAIIGALHGVPA